MRGGGMRGGERGEGDLIVRGRGRRRGGGGKKTFLSWFRSFIRLNGKKTEKKSFLFTLQHFCEKNHGQHVTVRYIEKRSVKKSQMLLSTTFNTSTMSPLAF